MNMMDDSGHLFPWRGNHAKFHLPWQDGKMGEDVVVVQCGLFLI